MKSVVHVVSILMFEKGYLCGPYCRLLWEARIFGQDLLAS